MLKRLREIHSQVKSEEEDRTQRYRNHEAVVELLEIGHHAILAAANRAAIYDGNLEKELDVLCSSLQDIRANYGA